MHRNDCYLNEIVLLIYLSSLSRVSTIRSFLETLLDIYILGSDRNFGSVRGSAGFGRFGSVRIGKKNRGSVWFGFSKNSWFGRFLVCVRKQPKFLFGSVQFGKKTEVRFGFGKNSWFASVVS